MVVNFDPVIFSLGAFQFRWYGFMYVVSFVMANFLFKVLVSRGFFKVSKEKIDGLMTILLIGMFLGARLTYVFVYNWSYYSENLSELLSVWKGGLSFHGGLLGIFVGCCVFAKRNHISWLQMADVAALGIAPGLFFGRMGNFINGELYGRVTDSPLGMIFPAGGPYPRHPSQLYEGLLEGIVLSCILWFLLGKVKYYGILASTFLLGYGVFRFGIEFFREPDVQLGYYLGGTTTMGQILCTLMVIGGGFMLAYANRYRLKC